MLVLVVPIERFMAAHRFGFTGNAQVLAWRMSAAAIRGEAARAEVLCFGDSLVKFGVLPRVLEAGLGRTAYNVAIPGAQPAASYVLLRRALASGARPRALVVDFYSKVLAAPPRTNRRFWPDLVTFGELLELCGEARDLRLFNESALAWLMPSVKDRHEIRAAILAAVRGEDRQLRATLNASLRHGQINQGAMVMPALPPPPVDRQPGGPFARSHPGRWSLARPNAAYVRRFLDLAQCARPPGLLDLAADQPPMAGADRTPGRGGNLPPVRPRVSRATRTWSSSMVATPATDARSFTTRST